MGDGIGSTTAMQANSVRRRLLYASGVVNYALKDAAFGVFVLFYYKQVLGLSGTLTGLAIALSVLWDAISDPLMGAWSDKLRSRWGRRHPLMVAAVIPLALGFIAMFWPPAMVSGTQLPLFYWLLGSVLLLRTALTFFMVPYLALGAEISTDYHERTLLASARTNLGWFVGVLIPAISLTLIFTPQDGLDGRFVTGHYHIYGILCAVGVLVASWVCIKGTEPFIPTLPQSVSSADSSMWRDIAGTFSNRNFRLVVILDTVLGGMAGIISVLLMVTYTYFWQLDTTAISILFAGPPLLAVLLVTTTSRVVNRHLEKQQLLRLSCALGALNLLWLTPLKLFGLLPEGSAFVFALIFLNYTLNTVFTIVRTISNHAMLADIADEHDLATGKRQEGVMFAAAFFAAKFVTGFGYLVGGPFLDLIGLESGMQPGEAPASVIWGLGLIMGPGLALLLAIPAWVAFRIDISKDGQLRIQQALKVRGTTVQPET
ncbi:MAG: MFS transporter [Pseudomonadales bacterium]|nr:MFS transporter [Halioglobus sp.]MCP5131807.1 MFS transporter [Pseudomonadales bacterium]